MNLSAITPANKTNINCGSVEKMNSFLYKNVNYKIKRDKVEKKISEEKIRYPTFCPNNEKIAFVFNNCWRHISKYFQGSNIIQRALFLNIN